MSLGLLQCTAWQAGGKPLRCVGEGAPMAPAAQGENRRLKQGSEGREACSSQARGTASSSTLLWQLPRAKSRCYLHMRRWFPAALQLLSAVPFTIPQERGMGIATPSPSGTVKPHHRLRATSMPCSAHPVRTDSLRGCRMDLMQAYKLTCAS